MPGISNHLLSYIGSKSNLSDPRLVQDAMNILLTEPGKKAGRYVLLDLHLETPDIERVKLNAFENLVGEMLC